MGRRVYKPANPEILPHWEIAEKLGILNTERATKIAQSRFVVLLGAGAALERALIQFMLNQQIAAGYLEVMPPFLVNSSIPHRDRVNCRNLPKKASSAKTTTCGWFPPPKSPSPISTEMKC